MVSRVFVVLRVVGGTSKASSVDVVKRNGGDVADNRLPAPPTHAYEGQRRRMTTLLFFSRAAVK